MWDVFDVEVNTNYNFETRVNSISCAANSTLKILSCLLLSGLIDELLNCAIDAVLPKQFVVA
jgi:hypothetical protein